jgi:hypothetical protein
MSCRDSVLTGVAYGTAKDAGSFKRMLEPQFLETLSESFSHFLKVLFVLYKVYKVTSDLYLGEKANCRVYIGKEEKMDASTASLSGRNGGEEVRPYKIRVSMREVEKRGNDFFPDFVRYRANISI